VHAKQGRTLVTVLHDLNQAARYATHMIAIRGGRIIATGPPGEAVTAENVEPAGQSGPGAWPRA
jgi:iron complex transport system ATP-binding protein